MKDKILHSISKILTIRTLRVDSQLSGPGRALFPGRGFELFDQSVSSGVIGLYSINDEVFLRNAYSKSSQTSDLASNHEQFNPPVSCIALARSMVSRDNLPETELGCSPIGLFSKNGFEESIMKNAKELGLKYFILNNKRNIADIDEIIDGKIQPVKFSNEIVSFDSRVRTIEELEQQKQILEGMYEKFIINKAKKVVTFYTSYPAGVYIHPINDAINLDIENAISNDPSLNPEFYKKMENYYKKMKEEESGRKESNKVQNSPNTSVSRREEDNFVSQVYEDWNTIGRGE